MSFAAHGFLAVKRGPKVMRMCRFRLVEGQGKAPVRLFGIRHAEKVAQVPAGTRCFLHQPSAPQDLSTSLATWPGVFITSSNP